MKDQQKHNINYVLRLSLFLLIGMIANGMGIFSSLTLLKVFLIIFIIVLPEFSALLLIFLTIFPEPLLLNYFNTLNLSALNNSSLYIVIGSILSTFVRIIIKKNLYTLNNSFFLLNRLIPPFLSVGLILVLQNSLSLESTRITLYQLSYNAIMCILIFSLTLNTIESRKKVLIGMLMLSIPIVFTFLVYNFENFFLISTNVFRLTSPSEEVLAFIEIGRFGGLLSLVGVFFVLNANSVYSKSLGFIGILFSLPLTIFSNERTPVILTILIALFYVLKSPKAFKIAYRLLTILVISVLFTIILYNTFGILSEYGSRFNLELFYSDLYRTRIFYWIQAFTIWLSHPLIGVGVRGFSNYFPIMLYPHNIVFDFLVSGGIITITLWIPTFKIIKNGFKSLDNSDFHIFSKYLFLFGFGGACVSGDIINNIVFYFTLVLFMSSYFSLNKNLEFNS